MGAKKARNHQIASFWRPLGDILEHFEKCWGPFRHILGFRSALGSIYLIKEGRRLSEARFWDRKMTKIEDFWYPKTSKIESKMTPKKVKKKHEKKTIFLNIF